MHVKTQRLGVTSLIAHCFSCGWHNESEGTKRDDAAVRRDARRHVARTGHTVSTQAVHITHYAVGRLIGGEKE